MTGLQDEVAAMGQEIAALRARAVCVASAGEVDAALQRMAAQISASGLSAPIVLLCVMRGGLLVAAELLKRLDLPLRLDYVQVSRYREGTRPAGLNWEVLPREPLAGASVIVVDDIFDEGCTLEAIVEYCQAQGAGRVLSAVLVDKKHDRKSVSYRPDVVGLNLPDRYLFGFGMDYKGYLRNCPAIYALPEP